MAMQAVMYIVELRLSQHDRTLELRRQHNVSRPSPHSVNQLNHAPRLANRSHCSAQAHTRASVHEPSAAALLAPPRTALTRPAMLCESSGSDPEKVCQNNAALHNVNRAATLQADSHRGQHVQDRRR
jgi:hypothetical protein